MDDATKKLRAENQLKARASKLVGWSLEDGHSRIANGNIPDALGIEPKGRHGALLVRIHKLQMNLIEEAHAGDSKTVTNMRNMLAERKLGDELEAHLYVAYENGLRSLRDELRRAEFKRAEKLLVDTGCDLLLALRRFLTEEPKEVIEESVRKFERDYNIVIGVDVFKVMTDTSKRQRTFSRRDSASSSPDGPSSKRSKQGPNGEQRDDSKPADEGKPGGESEHEEKSEHERNSELERGSDQGNESSEQNLNGTQMPRINAEITTTPPIFKAPTFTPKFPATVSEASDSSDSSSDSPDENDGRNLDLLDDYHWGLHPNKNSPVNHPSI
jgi:hypothetical protein